MTSKFGDENLRKSTGWSPANNVLPNGWLQKTIYMSPNNIEFGDLKSVLNFMQQDKTYTEQDMAKVQTEIGKKAEFDQPIQNNLISDDESIQNNAQLTDFNNKIKNIVH